jgi:hypothetical protein
MADTGNERLDDALVWLPASTATHRFWLHRSLGGLGWAGTLLVVMLNPSTADQHVDDPTIRRCKQFGMREGYADLLVANLFAWRATDPADLLKAIKDHGVDVARGDSEQNWTLRTMATVADRVLCAWGAHPAAAFGLAAMPWFRPPAPKCLGLTKSGAPRHPLFVRGTQPLEPFQWPEPTHVATGGAL